MKFHYLARAIISLDNKILLAREIGASHTFLPGGHIELGESAKQALRREINEELGEESIIGEFIGANEHIWPPQTKENHEICLVFKAAVDNLVSTKPPVSKESHIEFIWADAGELEVYNFIPIEFRNCIINYLEGPSFFWGSSITRE